MRRRLSDAIPEREVTQRALYLARREFLQGAALIGAVAALPGIACGGTHNIPDGECFTAPVKNSVQGVISYNAPSIYQGIAFDNVKLEFNDGKIVKATANNTKAINKIFNTDPGARYIGEFAIGFNPKIKEPMRDILFDEKIRTPA